MCDVPILMTIDLYLYGERKRERKPRDILRSILVVVISLSLPRLLSVFRLPIARLNGLFVCNVCFGGSEDCRDGICLRLSRRSKAPINSARFKDCRVPCKWRLADLGLFAISRFTGCREFCLRDSRRDAARNTPVDYPGIAGCNLDLSFYLAYFLLVNLEACTTRN